MMRSVSFEALRRLIRRNVALRICIIYATISTLWILLSDQLVFSLVAERSDMALVSMMKGIFFVLTTTAIIYVLTSRGLHAIRQREESYHALVETSPDAIISVNLDYTITMVNRRALTLLGYERVEEMIGRRFLDFVSGEDKKRVATAMSILQNTGTMQSFEHAMIRKDHRTFSVEQNASLVMNPAQKTMAIMTILRDVTDRKRSEDALRESEQRYRHVFQRSPVGILHYSPTLTVTDCNERLVEILQSSREQLMGFNLRELRDPAILPALRSAIDGTEGSYEGMYSATTGPAKLWVSVRCAPLFDEQNRVKGGVAILEDISERKWAEQALRNAERQYREIFEHAGEGIYQSTPDGQFIAANPVLAQMVGYESADELIESVTDIEHQLYVNQEERASFRKVLEKRGLVRGFLSQLRRKDGTTLWVSENARVVRDESLRIKYYEGALQDITVRKHAEEALVESEERYRTLVEMSPDAIGVHSDGKLVYANAAAVQLLGATRPEDLIGRPILSLVHPDYHTIVKQRMQEAGRERKVAPLIEEKFIRLDGTAIDVEVVAIPHSFKGRPAVQVVIRDITQRNQTEREIRLLAQTVASTKDCVSITDLEDRTLFVNDAFIETYGYTREELLGKPVSVVRSSITPPEIADQIRPATLAGGWYGEIFNRRKDGSDFPVELWTSVVRNEANEPVAMVGVARDITARKQAEESMQKLLRAIEQSDEVIFMTERDGTITYVNPAFERVYGFTRHDALGKTPRILKGGTLGEEVYRDFWALLLAGKSVRGEIVNRTKSGRSITVESSISPIHDVDGKVTGFIAVQEDITERKRAEEERKMLETQLLQAQKIESLGTLAGGIAHDFNNILGIILGHATLLDHEFGDPGRLLKSREAIITAVQRGASLVQQILTFARKTEVSFEPIRVNESVVELVKMLEETFPKTISFSLQLSPRLPYVSGDRTQLHQTLLNLCVNARDAMPEGGTLSIASDQMSGTQLRRRFPEAAATDYIVVKVSDTGGGMDDATLQRIFEPFFTTKAIGKGTGLGLAVVHGIIKSHHGFIDVESRSGGGTTFSIYLPVPQTEDDTRETAAAMDGEVDGGRETILFVEDEEELSDLVKTLLASKGYRVIGARNGEEAVQLYREHQGEIAMVVSDMGLPKMGGADAFVQMKALNPNVKTLLVSGYLEPETKTNLLREGARGFIRKPYSPAEILKRIRTILDAG